MAQKLPIVYVRGYAGTQGEVEETVDDPFYGFSRGSTHIRVNANEEPQFFAFESPLVRLMKDHGYRDAYYGNAQQVPPPHEEALWPQTIWVYRYYDPTSSTFTWRGERLTIERAAADLREFILKTVLARTRAKKVCLVAHSMGGLVARCLIQGIDPHATDYIDKFFTYGTPHGGIHFAVAGGGILEWVRDKIGWNNADDFGRERMYAYLTPKEGRKKKVPDDFDPRVLPAERFPVDRVFCVVGTNSKDYDVAGGLSRKTVGPQSDGLVQIQSAYVKGAHRAYVHRSHSGRYGMVNSEEGYHNLQRFLFGDVMVRAILKNALIPSEENVFHQLEVRVAIRSLPVPMHERTLAHECPILLTPPKKSADELANLWVENQHSEPGTYHLFTTFLMPKPVNDNPMREWAMDLAIYRLHSDARGNLVFDAHLANVPFWRDSMIINVSPPENEEGYYGATYVWSSEGTTEKRPMDLQEEGERVIAEVPFPESAQSKLGVRPILRFETSDWA